MKTELEQHPRTQPTWENQLWHARKLAEEKGVEALRNPHALTGRICGCGSCFCCAALYVYRCLQNPALPNPAPRLTKGLNDVEFAPHGDAE